MSIPKIFINIDGGIIQHIFSNSPVEIIVADFDIDGLERDRITQFKDENGDDLEACIKHEVVDGDDDDNGVIETLFNNILTCPACGGSGVRTTETMDRYGDKGVKCDYCEGSGKKL